MQFNLILQLLVALLQSGIFGNLGASGGASAGNPLTGVLGAGLGGLLGGGTKPLDPAALTGHVTNVVTSLLDGVHAGVAASTVTQLPGATVATGTQATV